MHPRALLGERGLRPKRRLGQNFLMDAGVAGRIARLCVDEPAGRVVEIGAGTGALTIALLALGAAVTAIEIDPDLVAIMRSRPELLPATILQADALAFDFAGWAAGSPWVAAGNLPYNIATPLIGQLLEAAEPPDRIVAMIQRDVADRLTAQPGTPAYGGLTLAVQYRATVRRAFKLGPSSFYPPPKVDSAVVVLDRRVVPPVNVRNPQFLLQVVRAGFAYRRKTLANSLALALDLDRAGVLERLRDLGLAAEIRGEQLDLDAFAAIADSLAN
ncbi:MAG: 16S rRNA (adenine(1518)-N(6)/adenine(1519)-N(6))-dimethyltransferase RsmA [Vulcanimicrobiaceae bacterium]